jgi:tryptophan-rich sensory protein
LILARIKAFGAFWYDFVIGDDWRVAVGVVAALLITWAVSRSTVSAWWVTPVMVALLLPYSLWRATATKANK